MNIHCIKNFFTVHGLWATCACPEKTELPWNVSLYWIYFLYSGFLSNLRLPCKQFALKNFTILNILHIQDFWATLRLPWKTELPLIHCMEFIFYIQDFWATCACPENSVRPEIFHSTEYSFYIQDFWATCACPVNSFSWKISLYWIYFLHSGFLSSFALALKNGVALNSLYGIYFFHSGFLSNLRLPWKQSVPWNFSRPPASYCTFMIMGTVSWFTRFEGQFQFPWGRLRKIKTY